jgi:Tol biopolymer transport system component
MARVGPSRVGCGAVLLLAITLLGGTPIQPAAAAYPGANGKIAFESDRSGNNDIWVMNADGTNPVQLTTDPAGDHTPAWSPDGTKIAFVSDRDGGNFEIYVMNADGSGQTRLTDDPAQDFDPTWSPDGSRIAFVSDRDDGFFDIFVMNADGSGPTNLTNVPGDNDRPGLPTDPGSPSARPVTRTTRSTS